MQPVSPRAGENVHFSITGSYSGSDACCVTVFDLGDGSAAPLPPMRNDPCPVTSPTAFTGQIDHVYTHAGTFTVDVQPAALNCGSPAVATSAQLRVVIAVSL
jgi:hypothetical protein